MILQGACAILFAVRILHTSELTVPLRGDITNAVVNFAEHTVSLVALVSDQAMGGRPVIGIGFNSIGRFGQSGILRERIFPRLLAADPEALMRDGELSPAASAATAMRNEKPGGHGDRAGAVAAVELAAWDLRAKLAGEPACRTIARAFGRTADPSVGVYAAGGYYYQADSTSRLRDELQSYRESGFEAFKIKIGGAPIREDAQRIEAALDVAGLGSNLAVDANGRFDAATADAYAQMLQPYALRWFEEPGDPLDYALNAHLTASYPGPIATGENLFSANDARNLLRYGGMRGEDVFQMDPGLSYGLGEYATMIDAIEAQGFSRRQCFPHGGHLINLHIVAGLGLGGCEAYPGVFQPFGGFGPEVRVASGRATLTERPGFGLEGKPELAEPIARLTEAAV